MARESQKFMLSAQLDNDEIIYIYIYIYKREREREREDKQINPSQSGKITGDKTLKIKNKQSISVLSRGTNIF